MVERKQKSVNGKTASGDGHPETATLPKNNDDVLLSEDDLEISSRHGNAVTRIAGYQANERPMVGLAVLPGDSEIRMSQRFIVTRQGFLDVMQQIGSHSSSQPDRKRFYFRGEACSSYTLVPSLLRDGVFERLSSQHGADSPVDLQKKLLDRYRRYTQHLIHADNDFKAPIWDDFDTLCLAQHHGLPTLLLDWTLNPYVAAYFALSEAYQTLVREKLSAYPELVKYYARVWVMRLKTPKARQKSTVHLEDRKQEWDKKLSNLDFTFPPDKPLIVVPLVFTRRIAAQAGRFVYCGYMSRGYQGKNGWQSNVPSLARFSDDVCSTSPEYHDDPTQVPEELAWDQLFSLDIEFDISERSDWKEVTGAREQLEARLNAFREEIMRLMSDLEFIGFHAGRLFPDLEGWARYLAEGNL